MTGAGAVVIYGTQLQVDLCGDLSRGAERRDPTPKGSGVGVVEYILEVFTFSNEGCRRDLAGWHVLGDSWLQQRGYTIVKYDNQLRIDAALWSNM